MDHKNSDLKRDRLWKDAIARRDRVGPRWVKWFIRGLSLGATSLIGPFWYPCICFLSIKK